MTSYISNRLTVTLLQYELITESEKNSYTYLTQILLEKILGFGSIMIMAIYNNLFMETILFLIFFSQIRKYTGGFHCRSFLKCMILSIGIYRIYSEIIFPFFLNNLWLNTCLLIVAIIIIITIGAVNHPNMHWNDSEFVECKKAARMTCMIEVGIIIAFYLLKISCNFNLFMSFGLILCAIMILVSKIIRQEVIS